VFGRPAVNIFSDDVVRLIRFYEHLGFRETFRTPKDGEPDHAEVALDGFTLGLASSKAAYRDHGLRTGVDHSLRTGVGGHSAELVLWTDDLDGDYARLMSKGARSLRTPHDFLSDLRVGWVADPDGNVIRLVERRRDAALMRQRPAT
jgi:uncharacterized glyoxalase superfamily protein PhnB